MSLFDSDGDFLVDHDLEAGLWDHHGYDCSSPSLPCDCGDLTDLLDEPFGLAWLDEDGNFFDGMDDDDIDDVLDDDSIWTDLATYHHGR